MKDLDRDFFSNNRQKLYDEVGGSALAVSAYSKMQKSLDIAHSFEQESNFWYLTGINEPDWWLIADGTRRKAWLVSPQVNKERRLFDGGLTNEEASKKSGISDIVDRDEAVILLRQLARNHGLVYTVDQPPHIERFGFSLNPAPRELKELLERTFNGVQDCRKYLAKLRAIKQPIEIEQIKHAIKITGTAFDKVRQNLAKYKYEYEIEARFSYEFRRNGADGHAYDPIIASGQNACVLHYNSNQNKLKKPNFILMDVAARYHHYSADITRTLALGKLTKRQMEVHRAVQMALDKIVGLCRPGTKLADYQLKADHVMEQALVQLGLIEEGDNDAFYKYFPHAISHGLGIDTHDSFGGLDEFKPGMVLTVEPGIYIPDEQLGVRIENDVYITNSQPVNLSAQLSTDY